MAALDPSLVQAINATAWDAADGTEAADLTTEATNDTTGAGINVLSASKIGKGGGVHGDVLRVAFDQDFAGVAVNDTVTIELEGLHTVADLAMLAYTAATTVTTTAKIVATSVSGTTVFTFTQAFIDELVELGTDGWAVRFAEDTGLSGDWQLSEVDADITAGAAGAISAVLPVVLDVTADLKAQGKLDATLPIEFGVASDLKAGGKLDAAPAIVFDIVADLQDATPAGAIDAVVPIVTAIAADLNAQGKLDAALAVVFATAADLKASGSLDAAAEITFAAAADLKASGQLNVAAAMVFSLVADLKAQGKLEAGMGAVFSLAANLQAAGAAQLDVYPIRRVPRIDPLVSRRFDHTGDGTTSRGLHYDNMPGLDSGPVSIAVWLNLDAEPTSEQHLIYVDQLASDTSDGGVHLEMEVSGDITFLIETSGTLPRVQAQSVLEAAVRVWTHIACRWDGVIGNAPDIFIDGVLTNDVSSGGSGTRNAAPGSHSIGGRESTISRGTGGLVAGFGRWERFLSEQEIESLAGGLHPLELHPNDLVICPNFDTGENLAPAYTQNPTPNRFDWVKATFQSAPFLRRPTRRLALLIESGVIAGAISATPPIVFDVVADLKAKGQLDAALAMVFAVTADLKAAGQLDAALAIAFTVAADLKAAGKLDAALAVVFNIVADLKPQLAAVLPIVFSAAADLKAQGKLDAALAIVFAIVADLKAKGQLDAAPAIEFSTTADLNAGGQVDATLPAVFAIAADLKAKGQLDAAPAIIFDVIANLSDVTGGAISAALAIEFAIAADLKAKGKLDAALGIVFSVVADLKATGQLDAAAAIVFSVVADLKARGQLDAVLGMIFAVAADLKADGKLDAALGIVFNVAADLGAQGKLDAALAMVFSITADLQDASTGVLAAALPIEFSLAASLTNATPAAAPDKLADPGARAREHIRRAKPRPRFYARQWNQFAETFDAFLRRQESLVRQTVLEAVEPEQIQQAVIEAPAFVEDLEELRIQISDTRPLTTAELLQALEADVAELIRAMREEEDILAIVALIASTDFLH